VPLPPSRAAAARAAALSQGGAETTGSLPTPSKQGLRTADAHDDLPTTPDPDSHTAIYDIMAHVVYMPDGERLEAHSGLGGDMDEPRAIPVRGRGPTPPNVYNLSLREAIFHGVRAIRLTPVGSGKMYGRDGILAHSYMLGPNGQSNGCVSFNNYDAFLKAYLRGEVDRIVVVEHLANAPPGKTGPGWMPEVLRDLFKPTERADLTPRDRTVAFNNQ
jgi:hypothetical protein